jgi:hypothetical protein
MVYMLHCGIKSPRATQRLVCNPGVVSETLACFYASAAVNCLKKKITIYGGTHPVLNPGCTKPSTLRVIIFRLSVLQGAYSVFLNFTLTKFCNLFAQSAGEFCILLVPGGAFAIKALFR